MLLALFFHKSCCSVGYGTGKIRILGCVLNQNGSWLCAVSSKPLVTNVWALGSTSALTC